MFDPTISSTTAATVPNTAPAAAVNTFNPYSAEESFLNGASNRRLPTQQQLALAAMLMDQQHQRANPSESLMMQQQQQMGQMQPLSSRKLFIGGLGQIQDDTLRQYYSKWGQVVDCIVIRDPATRSSRGFGFVTFATAEMADAAMSHRPHIISGKAVDAKRAVPREKMNMIMDTDEPPVFLSLETTPGCCLQLSGLNWEWHTLDTLRTYFEQFGPVDKLEMVAYPRGYGSLAFENQESVDKCLELGAVHNVNGHPVEIKLASPDSLVYHQHPAGKFFLDQHVQSSRPESIGGGSAMTGQSRPDSSGSVAASSDHSSTIANTTTAQSEELLEPNENNKSYDGGHGKNANENDDDNKKKEEEQE